MSNRVSGFAYRGVLVLAATTLAAVSLSGCSSLISGSGTSSMITGSTAGSAAGNLSQSMPAPIGSEAPMSSGSARFLPPADIGRPTVNPITTGSVVSSDLGGVGQGNISSVRSQALPPPISSGSEKPMSAQPQIQPINVGTRQPIVAPVVSAPPKLSVVADGAYQHQIQAGESLYTIARRYRVTTDSIVHANGLGSPDKIFVGQMISIPGKFNDASAKAGAKAPAADVATTASISSAPSPVSTVNRAATVKPTQVASVAPTKVQAAPAQTTPAQAAPAQTVASVSGGPFRWPVSGNIVSDFASSRSGINISAQEGSAVRAVENGTVIYVGSAVEGYGNLILVKHDNGYVSAYAHLKDITVAKGDAVSRGNAIGTVGMTGSVSTPQLHFELRKGATPVDPVPLLAS